mgnify:CR=1 FL=1
MKWSKKKLYAEEIAAIVTIPDNVVADASYDILDWMIRLISSVPISACVCSRRIATVLSGIIFPFCGYFPRNFILM